VIRRAQPQTRRGPVVALVHGWGSRAARLAVHVRALLERGFGVVAFDAPGHGESDGTLGSGVQAARALQAVAADRPIYGVLAHSLGAAATMIALREGLPLSRAVFISPPGDIATYADHFARLFGLRPDVQAAMMRRTARRLRFAWADLDFAAMAAEMRHVELLLVHDRDDDEVPRRFGERIAAAWPRARLVTTEGLGHHRIARDPAIVDAAATFLAEGAAHRGVAADAAWLDRELYERDRRHGARGP
jgi:pimeloyl-ACP methyl ester carboxylesterase